MILTGLPSDQFFSFVESRPINGVKIIVGGSSGFIFATPTLCTVGSSHGIGNISHSSSSVLPRWSHCSVPGVFVSNGFQPAPSTKQMFPSCFTEQMQTLSGFVLPFRIVRIFQVGFSYQTT